MNQPDIRTSCSFVGNPGSSAIILAGGRSSRMKADKSLLSVSGTPLIQVVAQNIQPYFQEIIISAKSREPFAFLPYRVAVDQQPGQGPLMGILCGLEASLTSVNFVIACDIPQIDGDFLRHMMSFANEYEIVVPVSGTDHYEPILAFYNKILVGRINELLHRNRRKIIELFPLAKVKYVPFEKETWYYNLNTLEDYENYVQLRNDVNHVGG
ncbi:MAG: molybdenum cofactor guanylyltransferase [Candidatus Omnitrophota bacterium]